MYTPRFRHLIYLTLGLVYWAVVSPSPAQAEPIASNCELCGKLFSDKYYSVTDRVAGIRRAVCGECLQRPDRCFACGLPIAKEMTTLADGRHYCARDAATALLSADAIQKVVLEAEARLRRLMVDEMEFPSHNLNVTVVDRINIEALFARPGNDSRCPNIMGYYQTKTNGTARSHEVYLLSGLSQGGTRAVFVHELTHAWMADHIPAGRRLGHDATEGFCELIAYLALKDMGDTAGMRGIVANKYTRGQFEVFRRAQETYNLRTVIEWLDYGTESVINANDIDQVRRAQKPAKAPAKLWVNYQSGKAASATSAGNDARTGDDTLRLKAVMGSEKRRTALINNRSFAEGETGKVKLAGDIIQLRCEEIGADFVRVEKVKDGEQLTLRLRTEPGN